MIIYECPECGAGRSSIRGFISGSTIECAIAFNFPRRRVRVLEGKAYAFGDPRWRECRCRHCGFKIPATTDEELFTWLDAHSFVELK